MGKRSCVQDRAVPLFVHSQFRLPTVRMSAKSTELQLTDTVHFLPKEPTNEVALRLANTRQRWDP